MKEIIKSSFTFVMHLALFCTIIIESSNSQQIIHQQQQNVPFNNIFDMILRDINAGQNNLLMPMPRQVYTPNLINNVGRQGQAKRPVGQIMREVQIEVSPFGTKETVITTFPDGSKTVEVMNKPNKNGGVIMIGGGNLNKGKRNVSPMSIFSNFDDMMDAILFDMVHNTQGLNIPKIPDASAKSNNEIQINSEDLILDEDKIKTQDNNEFSTKNKKNKENSKLNREKTVDDFTAHNNNIKIKDKTKGEAIPNDQSHSIVLVDKEDLNKELNEIEKIKLERKKIIDEVKKAQPTNTLIVKIIKTVFYVLAFIILVMVARGVLNTFNLLTPNISSLGNSYSTCNNNASSSNCNGQDSDKKLELSIKNDKSQDKTE